MKFFVQVWIDRDKVRARFKRYRQRIAELERQADDNRVEADCVRYAVQDKLDKKKDELARCRRGY